MYIDNCTLSFKQVSEFCLSYSCSVLNHPPRPWQRNMNNQTNLGGLVFTRVKPEEFQEVTDLLNAAYRWVDLSFGENTE